jgi:hypothetical protein
VSTVFPFVPSQIAERLRFYTDVRKTFTREFRDSLHDATQILDYSYRERDASFAQAMEAFGDNAAGEWSVPLWAYMTALDAEVSPSEDTFLVNPADYRDGGEVIFWASPDLYEIATVDTYSEGSGVLTLVSGGLSNGYPAGSLVAPVLTAISPYGATTQRGINENTLTVQFLVTDPKDLAATRYATSGGFDIVEESPALMGPLEGGIAQALDLIDNGFGKFAIETTENYIRRRDTLVWADHTPQARWDRLQFLHRCRGKDRPFWLPTFKEEVRVLENADAAETVFTIAHDLASHTDLVGKRLFMKDERAAVGVEAGLVSITGSTSSTITVSPTPGVVAAQADVYCSLAHLMRYDTDQFELSHVRTADGWFTTISAPVVEVPG